MEIKLKKYHLILILFTLVATFYVLNRLNVISHSDFAYGIVMDEKQWFNSNGKQITSTAPIIEFTYKNEVYTLMGVINSGHKPGKELKLIINKENLENVLVYDFTGFWLDALLYCLIPLMIVSAIILSFIDKDKYLLLRFGNKKLIKNETIDRLKIGDDKKISEIDNNTC